MAFVHSDPLGSTGLASCSEHTLKWNKLSTPRDTFHMRRDTSLGVIIGQVLTGKCQWWICRGLMSTICYPSAIYTWISEYILRHYVYISMYISWFCYTIIYFEVRFFFLGFQFYSEPNKSVDVGLMPVVHCQLCRSTKRPKTFDKTAGLCLISPA